MQAIGAAHNVAAGARFPGGQLGEGLLVEEVDFQDVLHERIQLGAGPPAEDRVLQQGVVHAEGGDEVSPGVAVALGVEGAGIVLVDEAIGVLVVDVVVDVVGSFSEPLGVVPEHAVVDRVALAEVRAAQKGKLLVLQTRLEVLEGVGEGRHARQIARVGHRDGGILGVAVGFARQKFVEDREAGGGQEEGLTDAIGAHRIGGVVDGQLPGAGQDGFVEFDKPGVLDNVLVRVEGHLAREGRSRDLDLAAINCRTLIAEEVGVARFVGVDPVEDALDPAHHQLRDVALAAIGLKLGRIGGAGPLEWCGSARLPLRDRIGEFEGHQVPACFILVTVAHEDELVGESDVGAPFEHDGVQAEVLLLLVRFGGAIERDVLLPERLPTLIDFLERSVGKDFLGHHVERSGIADPPFVIELAGVGPEVAVVLEGDLLAEGVGRFDHLDRSAEAIGHDLDDVQTHRCPVQFLAIVFRDGDVARTIDRTGEEIGIADQGRPHSEAVQVSDGRHRLGGKGLNLEFVAADLFLQLADATAIKEEVLIFRRCNLARVFRVVETPGGASAVLEFFHPVGQNLQFRFLNGEILLRGKELLVQANALRESGSLFHSGQVTAGNLPASLGRLLARSGGILALFVDLGDGVLPILAFGERPQPFQIVGRNDVGLQDIDGIRARGEIGVSAVLVIEVAAEDEFLGQRIEVESPLQGTGQVFEVPALRHHENLGRGRRELGGVHLGHREARFMAIEGADDARGLVREVGFVEDHGGRAGVEDDLRRLHGNQGRQSVGAGILVEVLPALVGQSLSALELGIAGAPEAGVDHGVWNQVVPDEAAPAVLGLGHPGHRRSRIDGGRHVEIAAEGIVEAVQKAPVAGDDPGVAIHIAPQGLLLCSVAPAIIQHGSIAHYQVERIGRDQEVAREDRIGKVVAELVSLVAIDGEEAILGERRALVGQAVILAIFIELIDGLIRGSRKVDISHPKLEHLVSGHFGLTGPEVVDLNEDPGVERVVGVRDLDVVLQGEGREGRVVGKLSPEIFDFQGRAIGGGHQGVFLVVVQSREGPVGLIVDLEIGIIFQVEDLLRPAVPVHPFRAHPAREVDGLVPVWTEGGQLDLVVARGFVGPGHVGVLFGVDQKPVLVVGHLQAAQVVEVEATVVDRIDRPPGPHLGLAVINVRVVVRDLVQDVARATEAGLVEGAVDPGGHFLNIDVGPTPGELTRKFGLRVSRFGGDRTDADICQESRTGKGGVRRCQNGGSGLERALKQRSGVARSGQPITPELE